MLVYRGIWYELVRGLKAYPSIVVLEASVMAMAMDYYTVRLLPFISYTADLLVSSWFSFYLAVPATLYPILSVTSIIGYFGYFVNPLSLAANRREIRELKY